MKNIPACLILSAALLCCSSPLRADETSKFGKAQELLQLVQSDQMMKMVEPMVKGMLAERAKDLTSDQRATIGEMQQRLMALLATSLNKAKPALVKVYTDTYTEEELDAILAFYKTPAGKALLQKMPEVMQRSMQVTMQVMSDIQPEIQTMMEGLKEKVK